jgi:hypothetical protein
MGIMVDFQGNDGRKAKDIQTEESTKIIETVPPHLIQIAFPVNFSLQSEYFFSSFSPHYFFEGEMHTSFFVRNPL